MPNDSSSYADVEPFVPEELIERQDLSNRDKMKILKNWQADLIEMQTAADENMPSATAETGETAERLARVRTSMAKLLARQ